MNAVQKMLPTKMCHKHYTPPRSRLACNETTKNSSESWDQCLQQQQQSIKSCRARRSGDVVGSPLQSWDIKYWLKTLPQTIIGWRAVITSNCSRPSPPAPLDNFIIVPFRSGYVALSVIMMIVRCLHLPERCFTFSALLFAVILIYSRGTMWYVQEKGAM